MDSQSATSSDMHAGLFPSMGEQRDDTADESYSTQQSGASYSDSSSFLNFRDILFNVAPSTLTGTSRVADEYDRIGSDDVFEASCKSLRASVLEDISGEVVKAQHGNFKYLHAYEQAQKERSSFEGSVFELSELPDYDKYVKQTHLNDEIRNKIAWSDKDGPKTLEIMDERELKENFFTNDNDFKYGSKLPKRPEPVFHKDKDRRWYKFSSLKENTDLYVKETAVSPTLTIEETGTPQMFLQRKLRMRHLQMISFGGTLGVGLFLNSGKAFTIAGGFGTLLAFSICGSIILATIVSFCEMVTFISVVDGVSGLSSRFVEDAFGFAVGWMYFASFAFGLSGEIVASIIMLSFYPPLNIVENKGASAGFVVLFLGIILTSNLIDVRIFGEVEYISSLIKLIVLLVLLIIMIVLNTGGFGNQDLGFKYWNHLKSDFDHNLIFGLFRPSFNLNDNGTSPPSEGIGGGSGRFLSLLTAILVVTYAYSGTEIVCVAACEAKNPRKALPSATRRVIWRILIFYCLAALLVGINIYSGDPRMLRYSLGTTGIAAADFLSNYAIQYLGGSQCKISSTVYAGYGSGAQSPWIVALQSAGLCKMCSVVNGFLVFFAISCGNAQVYVSSRTVYLMALQGKAPKFLANCNRHGIPYNAVLCAASFGLLAFICVSQRATGVFQNLTSIISSSGILVWFSMCISYIRFYYGLKKRPDIISRDDKSYPYKSIFQPYTAMWGAFGSGFILLSMGWVVFLDGQWDTWFFFLSYGTLMVFAVLYIGYKIVKGSSFASLEQLDFDTGRTEMDRYIWDGGREYNLRNMKDVARKWLGLLA